MRIALAGGIHEATMPVTKLRLCTSGAYINRPSAVFLDVLFAAFWEVRANNSFISGSRAFREIVPLNNLSPREKYVMDYHYETPTVGGFIQQLAVCYIARGYWFYVQGTIPKDKDPKEVDKKILAKYKIPSSKFQRYRRKRWGVANLQYLRWGNSFLILSTLGIHPFFKEESKRIKDVRREPIYFEGYSISLQNGHPKVGLTQETYENLRAYFLELAVHRKADYIAEEIQKLPYESYAPVKRQLLYILMAVNKRRKALGLAPVSYKSIRHKRTIYRPFSTEISFPPTPLWSRVLKRKHRTRKQGGQ